MNPILKAFSKFWNRSIQRQLILGIALVHAILMTIFVSDLVSRQRSFLQQQSIEQTEGLARSLAANSVSWVLSNDVIGLEEIIHSQKNFPSIEYAMILAPDGKVLAHTNNSLIGLYVQDSISLTLLNNEPKPKQLVSEGNLLDIGVPIIAGERHIGWARIAISQELLHSGLRKILRDGIGYTLLAILVGSLFAILMARGITSGIRHLLRVTHKVEQGETDVHVTEERNDELGELGHSFNTMIDKINSMNLALKEHNEKLGLTVQERTAELSEANQQLKTEITQRIKIGEELQQSEEKYRTLFENMLDGFALHEIVVDNNQHPVDYIFVEINDAFSHQTGLQRDDIIGKKVTKVLPGIEKDPGNWIETYGKVAQTGEEIRFEQYSEQLKKWWSVLAFSPKENYFAAIFTDITQRKLAEEQLAESDSLRELLLDIITHDLKNPASTIYSMSELAINKLPENEYLELIYLSSAKLLEVLKNATLLSQATFGEQIPKEPQNLNLLLREIAEEFPAFLKEVDMNLRLDIPEDIIITANPLIAEVFRNYISNALKYASAGKMIMIDSVVEQAAIVVCVKDFGKTIAEADREHIFERRTQLAHAQTTGRGLGLAIVKRIATAHDGEVWVEPNKPRGNIFCVRLPLNSDSQQP